MEVQQPKDVKPFKSHSLSPAVAAGKMDAAKAADLTVGATSKGRLRATPPKAPKAFAANRQTVRQHDREDRPKQHVITVRASAESQSHSPNSKQDPNRRTRAVLWSSLSHRKSKETSVGARTLPAHSASLWMEVRYEPEGCNKQSAAETPTRKKPTEGAL